MTPGESLRALFIAREMDARKALREALEALPSVEVVGGASALGDGALKAARLHPDLVFVAVSPGEESAGLGIVSLLEVAPGARVVVTMLEEWTGTSTGGSWADELRQFVEILREARAAEDRQTEGRSREGTLAMLAHDILTPTTAVVGVADLLLRYWDQFEEEQRREAVTNISEVGRELASLVRRVIRAAAADRGTLVGEREPVNLKDLLTEALDGIRRIAPQHRLQLEVPGKVPRVWVDRTRILEAVLNYLGNAVKYSPPGTAVRVAARQTDHEVMITVTDEGPGISATDRPRLFQKFSRLQPEDSSGHGLGLYLVKSIVEAHGGRVWVESDPGMGSTFGLALPATGRTRMSPRHRRSGARA